MIKKRGAKISKKEKINNKKIIKKSKKIDKVLKSKKIINKKENNVFNAEELFKARIKVIGIGGGGGSIVSEISRSLEKASFVVADTDLRSIKKKSGIKYFLFGQEITHGLGTGANPELGKQAATSEQEKIEKIFKDQDIVILISCLGGGLGSGATEVFAKIASSCGAITLGIFTLPFKFEGKNKYKSAVKSLKELREILNVSITIPNERIFKVIDQNTPITQAFSVVNRNLIESLESLIDLIYNPGTINIDFADLRSILRGKGALAFLNTVEYSGKNRAEEILKNILINPLYQNNNFVAEKILFNISGPSDMSMLEVEKISNAISAINNKAKIIFGISKNLKSKNKIKTTILMSGKSLDKEKLEKDESIDIARKPVLLEKIVNAQKNVEIKERPEEVINEVVNKVIDKKERALNVSINKKLDIIEIPNKSTKKTIRRSALDIKKEQEDAEKKRLDQEQEWEIPAFLRKVKFKS